jgi:hypothetical protein
MTAAIDQGGNDDPGQAAVKTHASLPDGKYLQGMAKKVGKIVEKDVTQPPPQNHPKDNIKEEIGNGIFVQRELPTGREPADDEEGRDKAEEIHQAVPTDRKGTKMK